MIISVDNITKYFLDKLIFENVSFTIEDNSRIGLIGINGAGKTTLIRILMDELSADSGTVSKKSGAKIGYLKQNATLDNDNTIYSEMLGAFDGLVSIGNRLRSLENEISIYNGDHNSSEFLKISAEYSKLQQQFENCDGYLIDVKIKTILNGMGFSDKALDTVISTLSGGEKTRLALAKLLIEEPDLLILDEPTNHLDFKTLMWLENYLISYKGAILTVSHDRYFLDKTVNKIIEIDRARFYEYSGNYSAYQVLREQRLTRELKEYEAQEKQIAELSDYVQRNITRASTSNMAKSRQKMLDKIEPITKPIFSNKKSYINFEYDKEPYKDILYVKNLSLSVGEGNERKNIIEDLSFDVKRGDKIALIGPNGAGKSTLLKALQGIKSIDNGSFEWTKNVKLSYFDQENRYLNLENTALEEIWSRYPSETELFMRKTLAKMLLTGDDIYKKVGVLSGGERAKLMFAILSLEKSNVLILDEPTNHIDLDTKEILENALFDYRGTLIFVSHDRYFLNRIPTKIFELNNSKITVYNGNYDYYVENAVTDEKPAQEIKKPKADATNNSFYKSKEQKKNEAKARQKLREVENKIAETEELIKTLELEIQNPEIVADYVLLNEKCDLLTEQKNLLSELMDEWCILNE